jgi:type III secretory pathway component EscV
LTIITSIYFIRKKRAQTKLKTLDLYRDAIKSWKSDRRKNRSPQKIHLENIEVDFEKSYTLWKTLSVITHESKWIGKNQDKIILANELRSLLNQHKDNYKELQKIERRVKAELINDVVIA